MSRRQSEAQNKVDGSDAELDLSETDEEEDEEKKAEKKAKHLIKEVKWLRSKLIRVKEKLKLAKKDREMLREIMKNNQTVLK